MVRHGRLAKACLDLSMCFVYAVGREQGVLRSIDDEYGARRDQRGEIRQIEVAIETGNMKSKPDGVENMAADVRRIRGHPADIYCCLDSGVEGGKQEAPVTTH